MAFLSTLAGIGLVLAVTAASGALCFIVLSVLNRLEVAVTSAGQGRHPGRR